MYIKQEMDAGMDLRRRSPSSSSQIHHSQQRVLADGWGSQVTGSVFCADSSLRYIYESGHGAAPPSLSSLAAKGAAPSSVNPKMATFQSGKRPRENSLEPPTPKLAGVDMYEAEVARACTAINKQVPALPPSFRECSVCLSANAYAQIGACGHTFHPKCFLRWFRANRSCPLCRGIVDKVQLASVVSVQDELEAIMSEIDDVAGAAPPAAGASNNIMDAMMDEDDDPLLTHPDQLMSFLETDCFDADMELVALDELAPSANSAHGNIPTMVGFNTDAVAAVPRPDPSLDDERMEDDEPQAAMSGPHQSLRAPATGSAALLEMNRAHQQQQAAMGFMMPPMQFAPTSAMPNYWNVLNQGLSTAPSIIPPASMPPPTHSNQRVVHIAPKPDAHALQQQQYQQYQQQYVNSMKATAASPASHSLRHASPLAAMRTDESAHVKQELSVTPSAASSDALSTATPPPRVVSCRCTGGCRNGRCACVKEGGMCGAACRCTSCKNPFLMVKAAGADIDALLKDDCFMHNVSKTRDMVQRLQEPVAVPCCHATIKVIDCVQGYVCAPCGGRAYDFSWCMNKLLDRERTPRNHCAICKRCCDHRDVHCHDCGRCYFAGVTASLPCPCKEASHKKRRENGGAGANGAGGSPGDDDGSEEGEGECSIM